MKTFIEFLNEKITKKEFDTALKDSSIIGGCEFEFYLKRSKKKNSAPSYILSEVKDLYKEADKELKKVQSLITAYVKDIDEAYKNYMNAKKSIKRVEMDLICLL